GNVAATRRGPRRLDGGKAMNEPLPPYAEEYLSRLRGLLGTIPHAEQVEILAELRAHLLEKQARGTKPLLDGFDEPEEYAASFIAERALAEALERGMPWSLGGALLVGARTVSGVLLSIPMLCLDLVGAALIVCAVAKPFAPSHVGVFFGRTE